MDFNNSHWKSGQIGADPTDNHKMHRWFVSCTLFCDRWFLPNNMSCSLCVYQLPKPRKRVPSIIQICSKDVIRPLNIYRSHLICSWDGQNIGLGDNRLCRGCDFRFNKEIRKVALPIPIPGKYHWLLKWFPSQYIFVITVQCLKVLRYLWKEAMLRATVVRMIIWLCTDRAYSISQEICTRFFALLCFVVVIHWVIFPYPSGLLHWHCGNLTIAPVPAKQPWWIWINTSCEFIMNDCITTTKQSTTKPCGYTVDKDFLTKKCDPNIVVMVNLIVIWGYRDGHQHAFGAITKTVKMWLLREEIWMEHKIIFCFVFNRVSI